MSDINRLFGNNRAWAEQMLQRDPRFFETLVDQQAPEYLWIGCSDSRVPANEIVGLAPGELFVHRNVANLVIHTDFNCLSVLEFAVEVLQVKHVIVCGHYGCGGVRAALEQTQRGLVDNWLRHIKDVHDGHRELVDRLDDPEERITLMCELNVLAQVKHVCQTSVVQDAWRRGRQLEVHGWIYSLRDGLLHDLGADTSRDTQIDPMYRLQSRNLAQPGRT
ncbi:MAG TPA: carbonate dehydratase [Candidatus Kapabacteria bacterium]|jgi:carbonic anhydrase|nr:carbonate dehydratase [Candidatus Kapabacteria bacterium]